jgi:hypothetical protein
MGHQHARSHGHHHGQAARDEAATPGKHTQVGRSGGTSSPEEDTARMLVDNENYERFLQTFTYYADPRNTKDQDPIGVPALDATLRSVRDTMAVISDPAQTAAAVQHWDAARPGVRRAIERAKSLGVDDAVITTAEKMVERLDVTADHSADRLVAEQEGTVDGVDPDLAMLTPSVHMLDKAFDQMDKLRDVAITTAEAGASGLGPKFEGAFAGFKHIYTLWKGTQDISEKIEALRKHGGGPLTVASTVMEVLSYVGEVVGSALTAINGLAELLVSDEKEVGEAFAKLAAKAPTDLEKLSGVVGFAVSVLDICVGAIDLFQAIKKGDTAGAIEAAGDVASGGVGLGLLATNAGLIDTGMITGMVMVEANGVLGLYQTYETEKGLLEDAYLQRIAKVIEYGATVARQARTMTATQMVIESGASSGAVDAGLQERFEGRLNAQWKAYAQAVNDGLTALGPMIRAITNDDDALAAAMGDQAMRELDDSIGRSVYTNIPFICQDVFQGLSRMGALAMKKYGPQVPGPDEQDPRDGGE